MSQSESGDVGTRLTLSMLRDIPITDIHVHLPGAISPSVAWDLGVKNQFITLIKDNEKQTWRNGPKSLSVNNPHEHYTDIFHGANNHSIEFDDKHSPIDIQYHIEPRSFKDFDRVMATVQGHRYPPGGIQTEDDLELIFDAYLEACVRDNIIYSELQQNIKIAHTIYHDKSHKQARKALFFFFQRMVEKFEKRGICIRFLNCFNKTDAACSVISTHKRAIEAVEWLLEADSIVPGVFVGLESAGHEKDPSGWPEHLQFAYEKAADHGFGCEAHGGEGIGSEHLLNMIETLSLHRVAHGFQMIEDELVIKKIQEKNITVCMSPIINIILGACVHFGKDTNGKLIPMKRSAGGLSVYIEHIAHHPIFELFRKYQCKIALCSDNPYLGGVSIKSVIKALGGLDPKYQFPGNIRPFTVEEIIQTIFYSLDAAFCPLDIKLRCKTKLLEFITKYNLNEGLYKA